MTAGEQDTTIEEAMLEALSETPGKMPPIMERYEADRHSLERKYPLVLSPVRQERMRQFFAGWEKALETLDFATLVHDDQIDYLLFQNRLRHQLRRLEIEAARAEETALLVPFQASLLSLEEQRLKMECLMMQLFVGNEPGNSF